MPLSDNDRSRLDGIVQQAQANGESDEFIQGMVNDFKSKYDSGQPAQPQGPQTYSGQGYMGDSQISSQPKYAGQWAQDALDDVRTGGQKTWVGTILRSLGAVPTNSGVDPRVGEVMAGPVLGPLRVAQGVSQLPSKPLSGVGNIVGGAAQAAGPFQALGIPAAAEGAAGVLSGAGKLVGQGAEAIADLIPSTQRAGQALDKVSQVAGSMPVDINAPGNVALKARELASSGGSMPKVLTDFIKRVTQPGSKSLSLDEARQFVSNSSRLSADEFNRLTGPMKRLVGQFTEALHSSIAQAAEQAQGGLGETYNDAINDYARAARLKALGQKAGSAAVKGAAGAAGAGGLLKLYQSLTE